MVSIRVDAGWQLFGVAGHGLVIVSAQKDRQSLGTSVTGPLTEVNPSCTANLVKRLFSHPLVDVSVQIFGGQAHRSGCHGIEFLLQGRQFAVRRHDFQQLLQQPVPSSVRFR